MPCPTPRCSRYTHLTPPLPLPVPNGGQGQQQRQRRKPGRAVGWLMSQISVLRVRTLLSHQISLTDCIFKDKNMENFKTVATGYEAPSTGPVWVHEASLTGEEKDRNTSNPTTSLPMHIISTEVRKKQGSQGKERPRRWQTFSDGRQVASWIRSHWIQLWKAVVKGRVGKKVVLSRENSMCKAPEARKTLGLLSKMKANVEAGAWGLTWSQHGRSWDRLLKVPGDRISFVLHGPFFFFLK